jgi:hypothetical protein
MCPSISDNNRPTSVEDSERELGVIIPLFLLLLPILILVISAAIDLNRWSETRRADEYFGQLAALKGLQVWMAQPTTDSCSTRMPECGCMRRRVVC